MLNIVKGRTACSCRGRWGRESKGSGEKRGKPVEYVEREGEAGGAMGWEGPLWGHYEVLKILIRIRIQLYFNQTNLAPLKT